MKYSIIDENGNIRYMPSPVTYEGHLVYHCGDNEKIAKMASELGYYPTNEVPAPNDGREYTESWEIIDGVNTRVWTQKEPQPETPTVEQRITALETDMELINTAIREGLE